MQNNDDSRRTSSLNDTSYDTEEINNERIKNFYKIVGYIGTVFLTPVVAIMVGFKKLDEVINKVSPIGQESSWKKWLAAPVTIPFQAASKLIQYSLVKPLEFILQTPIHFIHKVLRQNERDAFDKLYPQKDKYNLKDNIFDLKEYAKTKSLNKFFNKLFGEVDIIGKAKEKKKKGALDFSDLMQPQPLNEIEMYSQSASVSQNIDTKESVDVDVSQNIKTKKKDKNESVNLERPIMTKAYAKEYAQTQGVKSEGRGYWGASYDIVEFSDLTPQQKNILNQNADKMSENQPFDNFYNNTSFCTANEMQMLQKELQELRKEAQKEIKNITSPNGQTKAQKESHNTSQKSANSITTRKRS